MRRILWAAILLLFIVSVAAVAIVTSLTLGGNVKILNTTMTANVSNLNWGTLCLSCPQGNGFNDTSTINFNLQNNGQVTLRINYTSTCPSGFLVSLGQGNTNFNKGNGLTLSPSASTAVNATLFVASAVSGSYSCGVTIEGSA